LCFLFLSAFFFACDGVLAVAVSPRTAAVGGADDDDNDNADGDDDDDDDDDVKGADNVTLMVLPAAVPLAAAVVIVWTGKPLLALFMRHLVLC
jgi:hypothetical protein